MNRKPQSGFSLVEALVTLAISGTLLGSALPSMGSLVQKQRLQAAGETLRNDLAQARHMALASGRSLRVLLPTAAGACYLVFRGDAADCRCTADGSAQCSDNAQLLRHQRLPAGVQLQSNSAQLLIDGQRGSVTPTATLRLNSRDGQQLRHVLAVTGRLRSCGAIGSGACAD